MREIKVRGLDYNGNWKYGAYIYDDVHNKHFIISCWIHGLKESSIRHKTAGQYTGLKDKNGVEIYEGDIVTDTEVNAPVIYFKEECQFVADFGVGIEYQILGEWCEVIGNIYENPELLK